MSVLETTVTVHEQLLDALKAGHDAALSAVTTLGARTAPITGMLWAVPFAGELPRGTDVVDSVFGFAEKLLANQKQFATELAASVSWMWFRDGSRHSPGTARGMAQAEWGSAGNHLKAFQRSSLDLEVDRVLDPAAAFPHLFAGHSSAGHRYLIVQTTFDERSGTWMCAPITERALDCVVAGRAELRDALTHTATGTVDIVTVDSQGNRTESAKLCRDFDHQDLPAPGDRVPG
jgi:hypothetical protein